MTDNAHKRSGDSILNTLRRAFGSVGCAHRWLLITVLAACATASTPAGAGAEATFYGLTIVELPRDASAAILGTTAGKAPFLVIYVSEAGSYAALTDDGDRRSCVAWASSNAVGRDRIEFGIPASEQSLRGKFPPICLPFTVTQSSNGHVKIDARNPFHKSGPLDSRAKQVEYSGESEVLARVPATNVDWRLPAFAELDVRGVRLGPLAAALSYLDRDAKVSVGPLFGERASKSFHVEMADPVGVRDRIGLNGLIADKQLTGWSDDVLYNTVYEESFAQPILAKVFEKAIIDRYNRPSRKADGRVAGTVALSWFINLAGRQISMADAGPANCLAMRQMWIDLPDVSEVKGDIGPWGCPLVLTVIHDGKRGLVRRYSVRAVSGQAMAVNHFSARILELAERRTALADIASFRPDLDRSKVSTDAPAGGASGEAAVAASKPAQPLQSLTPPQGASDLGGITIVKLAGDDAQTEELNGEYLVIFVEPRGIYGAVVPRYGRHGGCTALGTEDSYTGSAVSLGLDAEQAVRRIRLQTYCPAFRVQLDGPDAVLLVTPDGHESRHPIAAHVALTPIDLQSTAFLASDRGGVRLGLITEGAFVGPLRDPGGIEDRYKTFRQQVNEPPKSSQKGPTTISGRVAGREITGLPKTCSTIYNT